MNKWPWDSFPEDMSTWEHCVKQYTALEERCGALEKVADAARGVIQRELIGGYDYEGYPELNSALHELAELEQT